MNGLTANGYSHPRNKRRTELAMWLGRVQVLSWKSDVLLEENTQVEQTKAQKVIDALKSIHWRRSSEVLKQQESRQLRWKEYQTQPHKSNNASSTCSTSIPQWLIQYLQLNVRKSLRGYLSILVLTDPWLYSNVWCAWREGKFRYSCCPDMPCTSRW